MEVGERGAHGAAQSNKEEQWVLIVLLESTARSCNSPGKEIGG